MNLHKVLRAALICLTISLVFLPSLFVSSARRAASDGGEFPREFDVRGADGVPKGTGLRAPTAAQLKALSALQTAVGAPLEVQYNGLTATPRHLFSRSAYLTPPSSQAPEVVATNFLRNWGQIFRFGVADLNALRLKSRATLPDTGTTILLFGQQAGGVDVYKGEVLVNVSRSGQVLSVGGENFPQLAVENAAAITPAQAVVAAADALGVSGFTPQSLGTKPVLRTYGDLAPEYVEGARFSGGEVFTDEIVVTRVVFPLGDAGRMAFKFALTTPQYQGIMWENIVDAASGEVLRRISLTAFQQGGGIGIGRRGTFRPDVQDMVEGYNSPGTARGKVFDTTPTALSGPRGYGRSTARGVPPTYAADTETAFPARAFRQGLVFGRHESPLIYNIPFGQVQRGMPDALNPTPESPFGWFYLPTDAGGAEVADANTNRANTRNFGYNMAAEARTRNVAENSPTGDGSQPFSATLTPLPSGVTLSDGRTLSSVYQSNYTEGNNVLAADDHQNDNETTHGIRGFSAGRQFTADRFTFINSYEYGGVDATGPILSSPVVVGRATFPPSTHPDIYPGAVNLFYGINILHDYLYSVGFTEATWNFQQDNFGRGGAGQDAVSGQVQDGSGVNNANFSTPADGSKPRMQMFLWTEASVRRSDGDFDFDVIAHEFYHGVSNRSVGKGETGCVGLVLIGESGGQGEGWSDTIAESMTDDDGTGEYVTGEFDRAIRRLPKTNYRWSYQSINQRGNFRRDRGVPDAETAVGTGSVPFAVHRTGEIWSATLWDMRELLIMKEKVGTIFPGVFFDGTRRLGAGTPFFIGYRQVQSVDTQHPINYRESFNTGDPATIKPAEHFVRPGLLAAEIAGLGHRSGPLSTAVRRAARLADTLVLRGMQLSPCNPSFIDSRDAILLADRELTGGENQAVIWRAFASHGVGLAAQSSNSGPTTDQGSQSAPVVVEDFTVPAGVTECEQLGPLPPPVYTLTNTTQNVVTVNITPVPGAATYIISRSNSAGGPFQRVAEIPATQNTYQDDNGGQGLVLNQTYYYQVRATRNPQCISTAETKSITILVGVVIEPAPQFQGADKVSDPKTGDRLIVSWNPALSTKPTANIVYDIYRADHVEHGTMTEDPTFTPSDSNRIAQGVTGTSFVDAGLTLNQVYYYIVQARDTTNGKLDTNNTGNRVARWNAPTIEAVTTNPPFPRENFESPSADTRFAPPLVEAGNDPKENVATFQRVTGIELGVGGSLVESMMYAPNFDPGTPNAIPQQSDFSAVIGPLTLSPTSIMEFDHFFRTEAAFDGSVIEIAIGGPNFNSAVYPDNVTTFDLGDYMLEGGYNAKLNGTLVPGVFLSQLQGRRAYTGVMNLDHVRISLKNFAPGGRHNPSSAPVYIRFRMTSDVGTAMGANAGWYIDNLVINNMASTSGPPPAPSAVFQFSSPSYAGSEDCTVVNATVVRGGVTNTRAVVDIVSSDGTAKQKGDYTLVVGRLVFEPDETQKVVPVLINEDAYTEGVERATLVLQNPQNGTLGATSNATLEIVDDTSESNANPIDESRTFVCTHYHDFLYRQGDQPGEDFWTQGIESCGSNAQCRQAKRVDVSTAFFLSIEFQETGYLVIRAHKAAFGNAKSTPRYQVFLRDQRQIGEGVVIGQGNWQERMEQNRRRYLEDFVSRQEFVSQFRQGQPAQAYVNSLFQNAGATPTQAERQAAENAYGSGDTAGRAAALLSVIQSGSVFNRLYNEAFVLMQYYGYLRRNPDDAPDNNFLGYDFWLDKMNSFSRAGEDMRDERAALARVRRAEMVRAFIESFEYRERFHGSPSGNQQGGQPAASQAAALGDGRGWSQRLTQTIVYLMNPAVARLPG